MALFWLAETPREAGQSVVAMSQRDANISGVRRERSLDYGSLYEGLQLTAMAPRGYGMTTNDRKFRGSDVPFIRNTAYACVDTFVAKIAADDPPKCALLTTEGSWKERRQAKDLERLIEAEYLSPKAGFATLHELWIQAFRLASASTGAAIVRFYNDAGRVNARIHDTLDVSISPNNSWVIIPCWYEIDDAVDLFGAEHEEALRAAVTPAPIEYQPPQTDGYMAPEMVCVYEAWKGAHGGKPGLYIAALDKDKEPLIYEEYPHEYPPIVKLVITPHLHGPWGHSIVHHIFEDVFRQNAMLQSIDKSIERTNKQTTYVDKSRLTDPEACEKIDDNQVVYVDGDYQPHVVNAPGFAPEHLRVANEHGAGAHDIAGVSELNSAGKKEEGIPSAVGQRFIAALINQRFADVQRRYIQAVAVDSAKIIIQILCDIFQEDRKLTRLWPGQESLREISASVALKGIESLKYVVTPAAVSGNRNSPADRQQSAYELLQSKILSPTSYASLQGRGYDLPEELAERDIQSEWFDRQMQGYMFATDRDVAQPDFYKPPLRHIDVPRALLQVIDGFLEAQMQELEDSRLELYLMLLADLDHLLADSAATGGQLQQSPTVGPLASAPMAPALPGAPTAPGPPQLAA
jgi:hypothetical protein